MKDRLDVRLRNLTPAVVPALVHKILEIDEFKGWCLGRECPAPFQPGEAHEARCAELCRCLPPDRRDKAFPCRSTDLIWGGRIKKPEERDSPLIAGCAGLLRTVFDEHWDIKFDERLILQFHVRLCKNSSRCQAQHSPYTGQPRDTLISES